MNPDGVIQYLTNNNFLQTVLGIPRFYTGRYCQYLKRLTMMAPGLTLVISFEHIELNDRSLFTRYDELYHVDAHIGDDQIYTSTSETMTPESMEADIREILCRLGDPTIDTILFG